MLLPIIRRFMFLLLLPPALIFFVALTMGAGQLGGWSQIDAAIPPAATFTVDYLTNLVHGELGRGVPRFGGDEGILVAEELALALPRSLGLLAAALALAVLIGLPLGAMAGLRRQTRFSGLIVFLSVLGISTPAYFAAMLLIWFGVWLYRTTGADFLPLYGFGWDLHLLLPALVLAARPAASVMRLGYNTLAEIRDADYVRTAHAKGLGPRIVFLRHILRNAGVPLLTTIAVSLRFSLAVLPIVEYIFSWQGIGQKLLEAVQTQDLVRVVGMILPLALLFVAVNLVLEVLYLLIDPRLRSPEAALA